MKGNMKYYKRYFSEKKNTGRAGLPVHNRQRQSYSLQRFLAAFVSAIFFAGSLVIFGNIFSSPEEILAKDTEKTVFYKNITIENGDSLWSIAEEYKTDICESTDEYVQYLKELNHLKSSRIYYGDKLIVAYNPDTIE